LRGSIAGGRAREQPDQPEQDFFATDHGADNRNFGSAFADWRWECFRLKKPDPQITLLHECRPAESQARPQQAE